MPQSRWIQSHEQRLIDVRAQIKVSTTKVGDFSTSFLPVDRSSQQKINRTGEIAQQLRVPAAFPEIQVWSQEPHNSSQPAKTPVARDLAPFSKPPWAPGTYMVHNIYVGKTLIHIR